MKKFLKNNFIKNTIGGNLIVLSCTVALVVYVYFDMKATGMAEKWAGGGAWIGFAYAFISMCLLKALAVLSIIFVLELLFRHRLKAKFFTDNIFFNIFFYFNFICTVILMCFYFYFLWIAINMLLGDL